MIRSAVLVPAALLAAAACHGRTADPAQRACTLEARAAFAVTVLDDRTGESLAPGATVWVREGAFVDTLRASPGADATYVGAWERPGTYDVVARHPGYREARRTGVTVRAGECHVITRRPTLRLEPAP